jgi:chromate reductase, NAD(P)H dehydrogenase (quinone)
MRILAISGSLRAASHNTALLRAAAELASDGVTIELYDELEQVPPYNQDRDHDDPPPAAAALRAAIAGADALLIATPEYNSSIPGQLKNAVDWASRPHRESALWGKTVGVMGASSGEYGALWSQGELRKTLGAAGARVLDADLPVGRSQEKFDEHGRLTDDRVRERLQTHLERLLELAEPVRVAA